MSLKKFAFVAGLFGFVSFAMVACAAPSDESSDDQPATSDDAEIKKSIVACKADDDCVAVPRGGCCSNGWKEAVNKSQVRQYEESTQCTTQDQVCPEYLIQDKRVPACNVSTKKCEMKDPPSGGEGVTDCRSTGCGAGKTCSPCWAGFSCIPHGAVC